METEQTEQTTKKVQAATIPDEHSERVMQLHREGHGPQAIAAELAKLGCPASRFAVMRTVKRLLRIVAASEQSARLKEEAMRDGLVARTMCRLRRDDIDGLADSLAAAARKGEEKEVATLTKTLRVLLSILASYERDIVRANTVERNVHAAAQLARQDAATASGVAQFRAEQQQRAERREKERQELAQERKENQERYDRSRREAREADDARRKAEALRQDRMAEAERQERLAERQERQERLARQEQPPKPPAPPPPIPVRPPEFLWPKQGKELLNPPDAITGKCQAGAQVAVTLNGAPAGEAVVEKGGRWRLALNGVPAGKHEVTATSTLNGRTSPAATMSYSVAKSASKPEPRPHEAARSQPRAS